jgi:lysozyme
MDWEGYRQFAYRCTEGVLTVGIGRVVEQGGPGLSLDESLMLLENDIERIEERLLEAYPWYSELSESRRIVLISMAFQLGMGGLAGFKKGLASFEEGSWQEAHDHFMDSKWAEQTPARAKEVCSLILVE